MKTRNKSEKGSKSGIINFTKVAGKGAKTLFEPILPATTNTLTSTTSALRDMRSASRIQRATSSTDTSKMNNSAANKRSLKLFKSAFEDIEAGSFSMNKINNDLFDDYETETSSSFNMPSGDDAVEMSSEEILLLGNKGVAQSIIQSSSAQLKGLEASSKALISSTVKSSEALGISINNTLNFGFNSVNRTLLIQNQKLDILNRNIEGIIEFNNTNALEYYTKSIDMMAGFGKMMENLQKSTMPDSRKKDRVFDTSVGFDIREYIKYVKEGIKESLLGTEAKSVSTLSNQKDFGLIGLISEAIIPKAIKDPLKKFDKSLTQFMDEGFKRLGEYLNNNVYASLLGLGDILGSKRGSVKKMNLGAYMKDAMPWNGIAQKALVEVIPELLTSIDSKLDNSQKRYYDYDRGQFRNINDLQKEFENEYFDTFSIMLKDSMDILKQTSAATGKTEIEQQNLLKSIQALIDDQISGNKNTMEARSEMVSKMENFGIDKTGITDFIMEFQQSLEGAISRINDMYHEIGTTQSVYRNINNTYGKEYSNTIKNMHRQHTKSYDQFSFLGDMNEIDYINKMRRNMGLPERNDDTPEFTKMILNMRMDKVSESEIKSAIRQHDAMDTVSSGVKGKFLSKFKKGTNSTGNKINNTVNSLRNTGFKYIYMSNAPSQEGIEEQVEVPQQEVPPEIGQGNAVTPTSTNSQNIVKKKKKVNAQATIKVEQAPSQVQRAVNQIDSIREDGYDNSMNKSQTELDKEAVQINKGIDTILKSDYQPETVEGSIIKSNNMMQAALGSILSGFKGFTSRLFGKEGFFKKLWDSDKRKKVTDKIKTKLFTGEDAIFKDQYTEVKSGLSSLKTKTAGELGKGYDFLYDNTMKYMYGENYKESESYQNNKLTSQTLNREWRAERKKNKGTSNVAESSEKVVSVVAESADAVAQSAQNLEESMEAFTEVTVGDATKKPAQKKKLFSGEFINQIKKTMPKALAGSIAGAGVGLLNNQFSLLGSMFLPGGPVAGAIVGGGLTILSQTEAFKTLMFGKQDPQTQKRNGGLITKKMQESFKKMLPFAVGGGVMGGLTGLLKGALGFDTGLGILGMQILPGGILGGAMMGAGLGILKNSDKFKDLLFGKKDDSGSRSGKVISNSFNKVSDAFSKIAPGLKKAGYGLGVGALTGAVLKNAGYIPAMLSLGGPIGMGIAGLGIGIAASSNKFNEWMFGTKDPETGERRKDGILSRMTNILRVNMIEPISDAFKSKMLDLVDWTKDKITYPFRLAMGPIMDSILGIKDNVVDFVKEKFDIIGNGIMDTMKKTIKSIFSPVTKLIGFLGKSAFGLANLGTKVALAPVSVGLQGLQVLTAGKRRKEYLDFYKNYYSNVDISGDLRKKWKAEAKAGNKRNIFMKAGDLIGAYLGSGEIADAARTGWNEQLTEEGKNHLNWRSVSQERREMKEARSKRRSNERQWAKIDKYRTKIVNDDLGGREVTLTDYQFNKYRKRFNKLGISNDQLQTSDDLMDLLYRRNKFKNKLDPTGNSGGLIVEETKEQKKAREKTEKYQDTMKTLLDAIATKMGIAAKDLVTERNIEKALDEDDTDKKRLKRRLKRAKIKNVKLNIPEMQDYDISELDSDKLNDYKYSKYYESGGLLGFMKERKITQKSTFKNEPVTQTKPKNTVVDKITNTIEKMSNTLGIAKNAITAQLELATNGKINEDTIKKRKGRSFGSRVMSKFNSITSFLGFKKKKDKEDAENAESVEARKGTSKVNGKSAIEKDDTNEDQGLISKLWGKVKSAGALIAGTKVGSFLLKGAKVGGAVGLLGALGFTVAELIRPGISDKVGAKIDAFTDYVNDDDFGVKKVFNDFSIWFDEEFVEKWFNGKIKPWWNDTAKPVIEDNLNNIQEFVINSIPGMITKTGDFLAKNADTVVSAFVSVIENIGVPLVTALAKGTPQILEAVLQGSWEVLKALGTSIKDMLLGTNNKVDVSEDERIRKETTGTQVATRYLGAISAESEEEAIARAREEYGISNPVIVYNGRTGQYEVSENIIKGRRVASDSESGNNVTIRDDQLLGASAKLGLNAFNDFAFNAFGGRATTAAKIAGTGLSAMAAGGGKVLKGLGNVGTNVLGKIPLVGIPFKITGTGLGAAGNALDKAGTAGTKAGYNSLKGTIDNVIGKVGGFFNKKAASEAAEEGSEKIIKSVVLSSTEKVTEDAFSATQKTTLETLLKKLSGWLNGVITNKTVVVAVEKAAKQVGQDSGDDILNKLAKFLVEKIDTILLNSAKCSKKLIDLATAAVAKISAKLGIAAGTLGIAELVSIGTGAVFGAFDAANLFQTKDPDWIMRIVSTIIGALLSSSIGAAIDFLFEAIRLVGEVSGKDWNFKKDISEFLYKLLSGFSQDAINKLEVGQAALQAEKDVYNALNDTNLTLSAYNDEANKTVFGKALDKGKLGIRSVGKLFGQDWFGKTVDTDSADEIRKALNAAGYTDDQISDWAKNDTTKLDDAIRSVGYGSGNKSPKLNSLYAQGNPKWANIPIGRLPDGSIATMSNAGCGPTAMAAVANTVAQRGLGYGPVTPVDIAAYATSNGYISQGGANAGLFTEGAKELGLNSSPISNQSDLMDNLLSGKPAVLTGKSASDKDPYTKAGHIVVADGVIGNKMSIMDPITGKHKLYNTKDVSKKTKHAWAYSAGYGPSPEPYEESAPIRTSFGGSTGGFSSGAGGGRNSTNSTTTTIPATTTIDSNISTSTDDSDSIVITNNTGITNAEELKSYAANKGFLGKLGLVGKVLYARVQSMLNGTSFWEEFEELTNSGNSTTTDTSKIKFDESPSLDKLINHPLNAAEELLGKTIERIYIGESGKNYSAVINDSNNKASVGPYQANGGNAVSLLNDLASATGLPYNLREIFKKYASTINNKGSLTESERKELSNALANEQYRDIITKSIDKTAMKFYTNNFYRKNFAGYYDAGYFSDLRTLPLLIDIGNTGPALITSKSRTNSFMYNWKPTSATKELGAARDLLVSSKCYYKSHGNGYIRRINATYDALKNYKFKHNVPNGKLSSLFDASVLGYGPDDATITNSNLNGFSSAMSAINDEMINHIGRMTGIDSAEFGFSKNNNEGTNENSNYQYGGSYSNDGNQLITITGSDRDRFLAAAKSQIGYVEKANSKDLKSFSNAYNNTSPRTYSGHTKYGKEMGSNPNHWCAYFTSWAGKAAGIPTSIVPRNGSCTNIMNTALNNGIFKYRGEYTAQPGDLVIFNNDWKPIKDPRQASKASHIGIVTGTSGDIVHTIEGNTSMGNGYDGVSAKQRSLSENTIIGFVRPPWTNEIKMVQPQSLLSLGYGEPKYVDIDSPAYREQLREKIDNVEDFKVSPKDFEAFGFGPGMTVDAGFDMTNTDSKLDRIVGIIAEWYAESKKSAPAQSSATNNINLVKANTTNVAQPAPSQPKSVQKYKESVVNNHAILSSKSIIRTNM